ncbi:CST complex subunit STN1 [Nymphaea colorata]|uniref:CST complex subunit STN1 n=1 Tax=Nymphaea colorata TaxID=210225 RepID=A0A5K0WYT3_9MAGN|nr:CST complex subunit STN1 [Nymphaea colorata]
MDPLARTFVKLLAFDFLSLRYQPHPHGFCSSGPTFSRKGRSIFRAEAVGVVVERERKEGFLRFLVDDGTGCIPCILWLNHLSPSNRSSYLARRNPSDLELAAKHAADQAEGVQLGRLARVRGRVTHFRGSLQITVSCVTIERDPNAEILHWLDCIRLATQCYDQPPPRR